mgnify:CR=1
MGCVDLVYDRSAWWGGDRVRVLRSSKKLEVQSVVEVNFIAFTPYYMILLSKYL